MPRIISLEELMKPGVFYPEPGFEVLIEGFQFARLLPVNKGEMANRYLCRDKQRAGAYVIHSVKSGVVYVGSSENIVRRIYRHASDLCRGTSTSKKLQEDFRQHGVRWYDVVYLFTDDRQIAYDVEEILISRWGDNALLCNTAKAVDPAGTITAEPSGYEIFLREANKRQYVRVGKRVFNGINDAFRTLKMDRKTLLKRVLSEDEEFSDYTFINYLDFLESKRKEKEK